MKYIKLDKYEKEISRAIDRGEFKRIKNFKKEVAHFRAAARETLNKTRNINIRLSSRDLQKLKAAAIREGLPYQTLISSVLHKYSETKSR